MNVINLDKNGDLIPDISKVRFPEEICARVNEVLRAVKMLDKGEKEGVKSC